MRRDTIAFYFALALPSNPSLPTRAGEKQSPRGRTGLKHMTCFGCRGQLGPDYFGARLRYTVITKPSKLVKPPFPGPSNVMPLPGIIQVHRVLVPQGLLGLRLDMCRYSSFGGQRR